MRSTAYPDRACISENNASFRKDSIYLRQAPSEGRAGVALIVESLLDYYITQRAQRLNVSVEKVELDLAGREVECCAEHFHNRRSMGESDTRR